MIKSWRPAHKDPQYPLPYAIGDTLHTPKGPVTVDTIGKRWFTGTTASGEPYGKTGIHIPEGEYTGKPWRVEKPQ